MKWALVVVMSYAQVPAVTWHYTKLECEEAGLEIIRDAEPEFISCTPHRVVLRSSRGEVVVR